MADFASTLVVAIVATIISVLGFLALILVLALYWTNIVRRIAPNRFPEPASEKAWPSSSSSSSEAGSSIIASSPSASPRSSSIPPGAPIPKAVLKH